jgi:hypothetical protein
VHAYATDSQERRFVPILLAFIGILAAWALNLVLEVRLSQPSSGVEVAKDLDLQRRPKS